MKVSIRKISELTGFSPATVSNALNHKRGVNAETAEKIQAVAAELGYTSEAKISKIIFVIFKDKGEIVEDTPFFPQMITGVEQECRLQGLDTTIFNLDRRSDQFEAHLKELKESHDAAVILLGTEMMAKDAALIKQLDMPVIVVDYWDESMSFDSILINNVESVQLATKYLLDRGHRKIGRLMGDYPIKPFTDREEGFRKAMTFAGVPVEEKYEVKLTPTMDGAYRDMKSYLSNKKAELPTAFVSDNDLIALGAMKAMWECGIRIPEDVSIVGFDDLSYSSICNPPLTTMQVPKAKMGRIAVRRLLQVAQDNDGVYTEIKVGTNLIERESVRTL